MDTPAAGLGLSVGLSLPDCRWVGFLVGEIRGDEWMCGRGTFFGRVLSAGPEGSAEGLVLYRKVYFSSGHSMP